MKLAHEDYDELTVVSLRGDLTGGETDRFRKYAIERMDGGIRDFVLDLKQLDGVDSEGLESLLWLQDQAAERLGQVRLAATPDHVQTILEMTRLAARFDAYGAVEPAVMSLR